MSLPSSATRSGEVLEDELNSEAPIRFEPKEEAVSYDYPLGMPPE